MIDEEVKQIKLLSKTFEKALLHEFSEENLDWNNLSNYESSNNSFEDIFTQ